ncbi:MAG TPA: hypothetical protein VLK35_02000 [Methylomirabilota bacterium]|nr:hypothetical protein [Methylomirabilota bacterium]
MARPPARAARAAGLAGLPGVLTPQFVALAWGLVAAAVRGAVSRFAVFLLLIASSALGVPPGARG